MSYVHDDALVEALFGNYSQLEHYITSYNIEDNIITQTVCEGIKLPYRERGWVIPQQRDRIKQQRKSLGLRK